MSTTITGVAGTCLRMWDVVFTRLGPDRASPMRRAATVLPTAAWL